MLKTCNNCTVHTYIYIYINYTMHHVNHKWILQSDHRYCTATSLSCYTAPCTTNISQLLHCTVYCKRLSAVTLHRVLQTLQYTAMLFSNPQDAKLAFILRGWYNRSRKVLCPLKQCNKLLTIFDTRLYSTKILRLLRWGELNWILEIFIWSSMRREKMR